MTAQAHIRLVLLVVSWTALVVRSRAVTSRRQRPMWLALLALAIEMLLLQAPVAAAVRAVSGVANLDVFVGGFCHVVMTTIIWTVVSADPRNVDAGRPSTWRWWYAGGTVVVMLASEVLATVGHDPARQRALPKPTTFTMLTVAWLAYLCFVAVSSADATVRLWRHYQATTFRALRLALAFLGAGTTASLVYVVARLITVMADSPTGFLTVTYASTTYFLFFSFGCVTAVVAPLVTAVRSWWQRCQLFVLWHDITTAVPEVVLERCPSWWTDLTRIRRNNVRLQRRVIEIRDAALALREWVTPGEVAELTDRVAAAGVAGDEAAAMVTARWLRLGRAAKLAGLPRTADVPDVASGGGTDIDSELRWLMRVRRAYRAVADEPATRVPAR